MKTTTDDELVHDLAVDGTAELAIWATLGLAGFGAALGLAATAGWIVRTLWVTAHRPESVAWWRSVR